MTTPQMPIGSGFGAASTTAQVLTGINLTGKTAIVTGGYSGLGRETARALRLAGARVIVPARDLERAANALRGIDVEIELMDLIDPASIDAFAARILERGEPLHTLVNCAVVQLGSLTRDARGFEMHFATNHLGHFQLVMRLWPALIRAKGARIVSYASWGHHYSPFVFEDPNFERRKYARKAAYGQSKTANILFTVALDRRGKEGAVRAFAVHPGHILGTGLSKTASVEELRSSGLIDGHGAPVIDPSRGLKTIEQGAATSVWCATSPQLDGLGGVYCENCDIAALETEDVSSWSAADAHRPGVLRYAIDADAAERLWHMSEDLLELTLPMEPRGSVLLHRRGAK